MGNIAGIKDSLIGVPKSAYGEEFIDHRLEQYKLCLEMADRVSSRRALANTFFIAAHTAILAGFAILFKEGILPKTWLGLLPLVAVWILCFIWWRILNAYRSLNSAKFAVIREIEEFLPLAPFSAEWGHVGEGRDKTRHSGLGSIENEIPAAFALLYLLLGLALMVN